MQFRDTVRDQGVPLQGAVGGPGAGGRCGWGCSRLSAPSWSCWASPRAVVVALLLGLMGMGLNADASAQVQTISTAPRLAAPPLEQSAMPGRVGRVAAFTGGAQLWDSGDRQWTPLLLNRPVTAGDRLRSERDARVEIQIGSLTLFLGPQSELELVQLDDQAVQARLLQGHLVARVRTLESSRELLLLTDELQAQPLQPGLYRLDRDLIDGGRSAAAALRGPLRVVAVDLQLQIGAGQRMEVSGRGPGASVRTTALLQDAFAAWISQRDQAPDSPTAWSMASPEITGVDVLDRYGAWETHPEAGWVWSPLNVRPGWAPFQDGRWVWVRPWGWTWVDDAPWGFAPSHYGRWIQWNSRWVWSPGAGRHQRPIYSPAVGHWGASGAFVWRSHQPPPRHHWHPGGGAVPIVPGDRLNVNPVIIIDGHRPDRRDHHDRIHRPDRFDREVRVDRDPRDERRSIRPPGQTIPPSALMPGSSTPAPPVVVSPPLGGATDAPVRGLPERRHGFERPGRMEPVEPVGRAGPAPSPGATSGGRPDRGERLPAPSQPSSPPPIERSGGDRTERHRQLAQ